MGRYDFSPIPAFVRVGKSALCSTRHTPTSQPLPTSPTSPPTRKTPTSCHHMTPGVTEAARQRRYRTRPGRPLSWPGEFAHTAAAYIRRHCNPCPIELAPQRWRWGAASTGKHSHAQPYLCNVNAPCPPRHVTRSAVATVPGGCSHYRSISSSSAVGFRKALGNRTVQQPRQKQCGRTCLDGIAVAQCHGKPAYGVLQESLL